MNTKKTILLTTFSSFSFYTLLYYFSSYINFLEDGKETLYCRRSCWDFNDDPDQGNLESSTESSESLTEEDFEEFVISDSDARQTHVSALKNEPE